MNLKNSFLSFYLVLVSFPIMSTNIIVPNEEILEKPFPLPYERVDLSESDLRNFIDNTINNKKQPVVIFGANWCPDCRILSAVLDLKFTIDFFSSLFMYFIIADKSGNNLSEGNYHICSNIFKNVLQCRFALLVNELGFQGSCLFCRKN